MVAVIDTQARFTHSALRKPDRHSLERTVSSYFARIKKTCATAVLPLLKSHRQASISWSLTSHQHQHIQLQEPNEVTACPALVRRVWCVLRLVCRSQSSETLTAREIGSTNSRRLQPPRRTCQVGTAGPMTAMPSHTKPCPRKSSPFSKDPRPVE